MSDHAEADIDDDVLDVPNPAEDANSFLPLLQTAEKALGKLVLEAALTRQGRAALKRHPMVAIVKIPHADWADIIAPAVKALDSSIVTRTINERLKKANAYSRLGGDDLGYLRHGRSVVYISPDPEGLIHEAVLAVADIVITIPPLTPALLRKLIARVTGGVARGVTPAMAALDLTAITSLVHPQRSAGLCVTKLHRAVVRQSQTPASSVPLLSALPLTESLRSWTDGMLADLAAVKAGSLKPDQIPFGVLAGPPGTGKTLIVESLAHSAGWHFVPTSVGSWFTRGDGALGGVSQSLKAFIDEVLGNEPAIGFMDELDALPDRATLDPRAREWWSTVVTLTLTEIDRVRKSGRQVLLLGATNYPDRLDSALVRPGRLQQHVPVLPPRSADEIVAVLRYYLNGDLAEADLDKLGRLGRGATPAMVEGWVKEARGEARAHGRALELGDILARMIPKDTRPLADIRTVAIHEAGHAAVAHRLGRTVRTVSIVPTGSTGGMVASDHVTMVPTWDDLCDTVIITLAGRAADVVLGTGAHAGAEMDLADATKAIRDAYDRQGLRGTLASVRELGVRSAATLQVVDAELARLLARAVALIQADRVSVMALADRLMAEKVLGAEEVADILGPCPAGPLPPSPRNGQRKASPGQVKEEARHGQR